LIRFIRIYQSTWLFCAFCGLLAACSSAKIPKKPAHEPVQLTEQQKTDYLRDFIEATKLKMFGNLPKAASMLTHCTEVNPGAAAAHYQLAEIYSAVDDLPNALRYSRHAARYEPDNVWYQLQLANLYVAADKLDSAILVYRKLVDAQPENADMRYALSVLYLENDQWRKARKELKNIEKTYGFTKELAMAEYHLHLKKNDTGHSDFLKRRDAKAVESVLKKAIREHPDELRFYRLLAELYSAAGRERDAQEYYSRMLEIDTENAIGYFSMIEFYRFYGNDAMALEEMQRMFDAKSIDADLKVELFLHLSADSVFFKRHYRQMDALIGQLYEKEPENFRVRLVNTDRNLRARNFEAAKDDLLFLTSRVQTNYFLWEQLFFLLNHLGDNETLYEATDKALNHFSDRYMFNFFHGLAASMLKKYEKAIPAYYRALDGLKKEKEPDKDIELQALVYLAEACNEEKRFAESDTAFEKALALDPNNTLILNNYSYYLSLREEKLELAEKLIKRCIAIEPNRSAYLDTYGWVLYKLGRIDEAIAMIEKAMKNGGGDNPEIVEHLCELLTVAGRLEEARHICRQAIELNKSNQTVEEKIESFKKESQ